MLQWIPFLGLDLATDGSLRRNVDKYLNIEYTSNYMVLLNIGAEFPKLLLEWTRLSDSKH